MTLKTIDTKLFFEDGIWEKDLVAKDYLAERVQETDPESEFGKKIGDLRKAPKEIIMQNMGMFKEQNYEIMLGYLKKPEPSHGLIVGHMAFQQHNNDWHLFQCYVKPEFRGKEYAHTLSEEVLKHAKRKMIKKVKFGAGGHDSMIHLLEKLKEKHHSSIIDINLDTHQVELR